LRDYDVIVVGKGNAALCAALAAREHGVRVAMLEAANEDESGGNSRFAGGVMRFAYSSVDELKEVTEITDDEIANSDFGTNTTDAVDYPDYAKAVALAVLHGDAERAILICGSGAGACVAANKFKGIRAATCHDSFSARQCVEDDDVNVLCLGARVIGPELALEVVRDYVGARFSGAERHRRRLGKVAAFEDSFGR